MFRHNLWFSPDQFIIFALFVAVFVGRGKKFLSSWAPFILLFLGYEALRGINPEHTKIAVNITNIIDLEKALFRSIPTIWLQKIIFNPHNLKSYDFYFSIIYMSHFVAFLSFAFALWWKKNILFQQFTFTILLLSYLAFITFIFFPVMPPWMASEQGYLPHIYRIMYLTTPIYTQPGLNVPTIYSVFSSNNYAAIPSLHSAYPFVILLFSILTKRKILILTSLIYTLSVWFAVVYLGEHYVIDVIIGVIYALVSFKVIHNFAFKKN